MRRSWAVQMVHLHVCKIACAFKQSQTLSLVYIEQIYGQEYSFVNLGIVGVFSASSRCQHMKWPKVHLCDEQMQHVYSCFCF